MVSGVRYLSHPPGTGQSDAAEEYIAALRALPLPVTWIPLMFGTRTWGLQQPLAPFPGRAIGGCRHDDICNAAVEYDTTIVHSTSIWNPAWDRHRDGRLIAYTTFEGDRLPAWWVRVLNRYDAVLVPSTHNVEVFRRSGLRAPLRRVPHIVRPAPPRRPRWRPFPSAPTCST